MLIGLALGAIVALVASAAFRFLRMDDAAEHAAAARQERKRVVFEGVVTPRAVREVIEPALLETYAGDPVTIVVQRVKPAREAERGAPERP
jgi:hypothetical protein